MDTEEQLRDGLARLAAQHVGAPVHLAQRAVLSQRRRRLTARVSVAAVAVLVAALAVTLTGQQNHGRVATARPQKPQVRVLSFVRQHGYLYVIIRNTFADARRYSAELRAHGLSIKLSFVPVSPSLVNRVIEFTSGPGITVLQPPSSCARLNEKHGQGRCLEKVRIPLGYRGSASIVFGRQARPGEQYESMAKATAPGEILHGLHILNVRLSTVLALLRARHVRVTRKFGAVVGNSAKFEPARLIPRTWFVYDAMPWSPGTVLLNVGPKPCHHAC